MRTQLGTYCQQFDATLRPVLTDFGDAVQALERAAAGTPGRPLLGRLRELRHQLQALHAKVAEQQAYVLIFGPLKSGKSTLMNAIAAAYVSEVSSLPAYPCLVFVAAGEQRGYEVTCYDGSVRRHRTAAELRADLDHAHAELAQAIRKAEQAGTAFDPQEHLPEAIRRIDVHVVDSDLDATGAVLVDTPGLYTRMRFGYDRMTREFRSAAACAIFVVKSDTLFLEQVFAEFQQLLDLFSRIFLVVNVDAQKRDVSPDGRLVPSLEQSEPEAILRAFEQLAMSAPLLRAAREGRVRMYAVDLLHAASSALQKAPEERTPASFRAFRRELADYLASSEYMAAFLRDSLQRADSLLAELASHLDSADARRLDQRRAELDEQCAWLDAERRHLAHALQLDWTQAHARGSRELDAALERAARDAGARLLRTLGASIDTWFLSSHSLEWLIQGQWAPLVADYRDEVLAAGRRTCEQILAQAEGGLDLPAPVPDLLRRAGIDMRALRAQALAGSGAVVWPARAGVPVDLAGIPVRKGLLDSVIFRSLDRVRARLFGPPDRPDNKLPARDKARFLGEAGRLHLHQCVARFRAALQPETIGTLREHFAATMDRAATAAARQGLGAYQPRLDDKRRELDAERLRLDALATPMRRLLHAVHDLRPKLAALEIQFAREVVLPRPDKDVVLAPARRLAPEAAPGARGAARPRQTDGRG